MPCECYFNSAAQQASSEKVVQELSVALDISSSAHRLSASALRFQTMISETNL